LHKIEHLSLLTNDRDIVWSMMSAQQVQSSCTACWNSRCFCAVVQCNGKFH